LGINVKQTLRALLLDVVICHGAHAAVGPYILCRLYHVDDSIDGEDDTHDADGRTLTGHQREGEKITTHGHTGIADGRDDGDDEPEKHRGEREDGSAVLHDEETCDKYEGGTAVHVDRRADRQHEA
jgi:hypothetical protein